MGRQERGRFGLPGFSRLLSQPEFESGGKTLVRVVSRRLARKCPADWVDLASFFFSARHQEEQGKLKVMVDALGENVSQFSQPAWRLFRDNLILLPSGPFLRASSYHGDMWLRDSFFG